MASDKQFYGFTKLPTIRLRIVIKFDERVIEFKAEAKAIRQREEKLFNGLLEKTRNHGIILSKNYAPNFSKKSGIGFLDPIPGR